METSKIEATQYYVVTLRALILIILGLSRIPDRFLLPSYLKYLTYL